MSITPQNASLFKTVRLRALQDAPYAFSATYAKESQVDDAGWLKRVERKNGERGIGFLAMDGETACGIVGAFLDANDATRAQLVSMWTAPTCRQRGVGRMLVNEVLARARLRDVRDVEDFLEMVSTALKRDARIRSGCCRCRIFRTYSEYAQVSRGAGEVRKIKRCLDSGAGVFLRAPSKKDWRRRA